jgi:hypothetical protein
MIFLEAVKADIFQIELAASTDDNFVLIFLVVMVCPPHGFKGRSRKSTSCHDHTSPFFKPVAFAHKPAHYQESAMSHRNRNAAKA